MRAVLLAFVAGLVVGGAVIYFAAARQADAPPDPGPVPDAAVAEVVSLDGEVLGTVPVLKVGGEWVGSGTVAGVPVEVRTDCRHSLDHYLPGLPSVNVRLRAPTGTRVP